MYRVLRRTFSKTALHQTRLTTGSASYAQALCGTVQNFFPYNDLLPLFRNRRNGVDKLLQLSLEHLSNFRIGEFLLPPVLFCHDLPPQFRIAEHMVCRQCRFHGIIGGQQNAASAQRIGNCRRIVCQNRQIEVHRFHQRHTEALVVTHAQKQVCQMIVCQNLCKRNDKKRKRRKRI